MARTRASVGAKVSSGKSSKARCSVAPPSSSNTSSAGTSKSKPKRNIIESDDEESGPVNKELDKTIELEPLVGEDSHKIEEYYDKNNKGKGVGKKTKGKENIDGNVERRNSKRDLEVSDQLPETKRVKVN